MDDINQRSTCLITDLYQKSRRDKDLSSPHTQGGSFKMQRRNDFANVKSGHSLDQGSRVGDSVSLQNLIPLRDSSNRESSFIRTFAQDLSHLRIGEDSNQADSTPGRGSQGSSTDISPDEPSSGFRDRLLRSRRSASCRSRSAKRPTDLHLSSPAPSNTPPSQSSRHEISETRHRTYSMPTKAANRKAFTNARRAAISAKNADFTTSPRDVYFNRSQEEEDDKEIIRIRTFSTSSKGIQNRGDSFKRRKASIRSRPGDVRACSSQDCVWRKPDVIRSVPQHRSSANGSQNGTKGCFCSVNPPYSIPNTFDLDRGTDGGQVSGRVIVLGSTRVGKTSIIKQFMTSEYLGPIEDFSQAGVERLKRPYSGTLTPGGDPSTPQVLYLSTPMNDNEASSTNNSVNEGEHDRSTMVSVQLDEIESTLELIEVHSSRILSPQSSIIEHLQSVSTQELAQPPSFTSELVEDLKDGQAYCILYSVTSRDSYLSAVSVLKMLKKSGRLTPHTAAILVGNKADLERHRQVSLEEDLDVYVTTDGKVLAARYGTKFVEVSALLNHNIDDLLVGLLRQIELRRGRSMEVSPSTTGGHREGGGCGRSSGCNVGREIVELLLGKQKRRLFQSCDNLLVL